MTKVVFRTELFAGENDGYIGFCPELDVAGSGSTREEASKSLRDAVEVFLEGCNDLGTLNDILEESGFEMIDGVWHLRRRVTSKAVAIIP